jgi:hypothetical protein
MSIGEAAELAGITKPTGYTWIKRWNSKGYEDLIPEFGGRDLPNSAKSTEGKTKGSDQEQRSDIMEGFIDEMEFGGQILQGRLVVVLWKIREANPGKSGWTILGCTMLRR